MKSKAQAMIMVADGTGGMTQVKDRRFEAGDWPILFNVSKKEADTWLQYLSAECTKSGWSVSSIGQMDAKENSGSLTVNAGADGQLAVVWERKRGGLMKVRARSTGEPELPLTKARELIERVNDRSRSAAKEQFLRHGYLYYTGLPWCGELWLGDSLRLYRPSKQDNEALFGPRIILVDEQLHAIDSADANSAFAVRLRELSVFLSVVTGHAIRVSANAERVWTWTTDTQNQVECDTRSLGYFEKEWLKEMPTRGQVPPVPLYEVHRPDFSRRSDVSQTELRLPADVLDLWQAFSQLQIERRRQFLQVGSMWQLALSLDEDHETMRFALMVAACEALKPSDRQFRDRNIYGVVEGLLGSSNAEFLREQLQAQDVRDAHLHSGEFRGDEFAKHIVMSSFQDPTFGFAGRDLRRITQASIIEWLRLGGIFTIPTRKRQKKSWRRWVKKHDMVLLPACLTLGIVVGFALGWIIITS
ncbi:MAG: hypothetical protein O7I42_14955 [Alphaproteobacteria bacterium]|nr:hypothetical protein [Alphaproteobacteria bacterium]